jgi:hypothetical protein
MTTSPTRRSPSFLFLLTLTGLALLAAGAATWFLWPVPKPTARVQLYIPSAQPSIMFPGDNRNMGGDMFLRNQADIIKDRLFLSAALNVEGVAALPVVAAQVDQLQWLENEIKVEFPGSEFLQISMSGDRPKELLVVVEAVRQVYLKEVIEKDRTDRQGLLKQLEDIQMRYEQRSKKNRELVRQLSKDTGAIDPKGLAFLQNIYLEEFKGVMNDLVKVKSQLRELRGEIGLKPDWPEAIWPHYALLLGSFPAPGLPVNVALVGLLRDESLAALPRLRPFVSQAQLDQDPIAAELLKKIGKLKSDIITVKASSPSEAAFQKDSASLRSALDLAQKELETRRQELRSQLEEDFRARARNEALANRPQSPRQRYATALATEQALLADAQRLESITAKRNNAAVDLDALKDEIARADEFMKKAGHRMEVLKIEQDAPQRVKKFGKGSIYTPDGGEAKRMAIASSLAGLGVLLLTFAGYRFASTRNDRAGGAVASSDEEEGVAYTMRCKVCGAECIVESAVQPGEELPPELSHCEKCGAEGLEVIPLHEDD